MKNKTKLIIMLLMLYIIASTGIPSFEAIFAGQVDLTFTNVAQVLVTIVLLVAAWWVFIGMLEDVAEASSARKHPSYPEVFEESEKAAPDAHDQRQWRSGALWYRSRMLSGKSRSHTDN